MASKTVRQFVAYYRVSTHRQEATGLWLAAQCSGVRAHVKAAGGRAHIYNVSRLARRTEDHLAIRATLAKVAVGVISVTEALDELPIGQLMETMLAAFAQFDNDVRRERVTAGMRAVTNAGRWPHKAPLGYRNNGRKSPSLLVDPEKAPIVLDVFRRIASGESATAVRRDARRAEEPGGRVQRQNRVRKERL